MYRSLCAGLAASLVLLTPQAQASGPVMVIAQSQASAVANAPQISLYKQLMNLDGTERFIRENLLFYAYQLKDLTAKRKGKAKLDPADEARANAIITTIINDTLPGLLDKRAGIQAAQLTEVELQTLITAHSNPVFLKYNNIRVSDTLLANVIAEPHMWDVADAISHAYTKKGGYGPVSWQPDARAATVVRLIEIDGTKRQIDNHVRYQMMEISEANLEQVEPRTEADRQRLSVIEKAAEADFANRIIRSVVERYAPLLNSSEVTQLIQLYDTPLQRKLIGIRERTELTVFRATDKITQDARYRMHAEFAKL